MNKPAVYRSDGSAVALGDRIGRGGEGEVYAIANDNSHAVKIYSGAGGADRRDKIVAMVAARLAEHTPLAAFPIQVVKKRDGQFAGFIMRKVSGHEPLFEIYSPGARKSNFPQANYPFLTLAASNFARAVGAVHETGCVIGDINHSGVLISRDAKVSLIDADSFQLVEGNRRFLCRVGVPDYTPPELQGLKLNTVVRMPNHDNFGVAIVIFQLLFMGRHPFSGAYRSGDMPIEKAISEHRFAYSTTRSVGMTPPPGAPLLKHFPPQIGAAFERAFAPGGVRPGPRDWISLLADLNRGLNVCKSDPLHHYWHGSPECPWCRMERLQGISLFLPPITQGQGASRDPLTGGSFRIDVAWRTIEGVTAPGPCTGAPRVHNRDASPSAEAQALHTTVWKQRLVGCGGIALAVAILLTSPSLWLFWVPAGWFGFAKMLGGGPGPAKLRTRKAELDRRWATSVADWRKGCGDVLFDKTRSDLHQAKIAYSGLAAEQALRITKYTQNRREFQLKAYLATFYIRRAQISGIGPTKTATLASYGIETAADITSLSRVERVPGFGPATAINLMAWRRVTESRFVYNPNTNAADHTQLSSIKAEIAQKEAQLRQQLTNGPENLKKIAASAISLRQSVNPELQRLSDEIAQVEADLAHIGRTVSISGKWIAAAIASLLIIAGLFNMNWSTSPSTESLPVTSPGIETLPKATQETAAEAAVPEPDEVTPIEAYESSIFYAVRQTNVRARPSTATPIVASLDRAAAVQGVILTGPDGKKPWLKITNGPYKGYYVSSAANLSADSRPDISPEYVGRKIVIGSTIVYREARRDGAVLVELPAGTKLSVVGTTNDGLAEVSLKSGAVGYVETSALAEPGTAIPMQDDATSAAQVQAINPVSPTDGSADGTAPAQPSPGTITNENSS